ncbi:hypothetical protein M434DRAFT_11566 [Hypoxylon sp. CO27-5]|nr:hypothetical protein M434DRAFT_11566 [Hypoxylon sp. CO27-5]
MHLKVVRPEVGDCRVGYLLEPDKYLARKFMVLCVDHPMHEATNYYNDNKWKILNDDDSEGAIAKDTWSSNENKSTNIVGGRRYDAAKICVAITIGEIQRLLDIDLALTGISIDP